MASTFTLKSSSYDGRYMELVCTQTSNGGAKNTSTIKWTLTTKGGSNNYYSTGATTVVINGATVYSKGRTAWSSKTFPASKGSVSGEVIVSHTNDGSKSIDVSFSTAIYTSTVSKYSDKWTLDSIPRYPTVSQSLNSKTETSITLNWSADAECDYVYYQIRKGNGSWSKETPYGATNGKSGTMTIKDLEANTSYSIQVHLRRKDSQLIGYTAGEWTTTTTHNYPHCTSSPNFVIGEKVTLKFYNPLKRAFKFYIIGNGTQLDVEYECDSDEYEGLTSEKTSVPYLYATLPNSQSGEYKVKVVYGNSVITRDNGNTYSVDPSKCAPTFSNFTYKDGFLPSNITGNNQALVKGISNLVVTIPSANKMIALNEATPKKYVVTIDTISKTVDYSTGDVTIEVGQVKNAGVKRLSIIAYDSRDIPTVAYKDVTIYEYEKPVIYTDIKRLNNFEAQTTLKVSGNYSPLIIDGIAKNTYLELVYRYREAGGEWSGVNYASASLNEEDNSYTCDDIILSLDNSKSFEFEITVADSLSQNKISATVGVGQAIFFISTNKKTCYINGVEIPTVESLFPIGSVYCSSTNKNPSETYGGTWKLIDKGFKTDSTEITQGATEYLSNFVVASIRTGQTLRLRMALTTAKDINDTSVTLGTVDLQAHGLQENNESYFLYGIFGGVAMSDGGNATITYDFNNTGILEVNDCLNVDGTHVLPAGSSFYINAVITTSQSRMIDTFCDKFYWERTA